MPYYSLAAFKLVLKSWALVFGLALVCGLAGGLLKWVGYEPLSLVLLISALALFLRTLFGTALPEELLFRGVFMNLLLQWLEQSGQWRRYFHGSLILLPLAAVAGYTIDNKAHWFPLHGRDGALGVDLVAQSSRCRAGCVIYRDADSQHTVWPGPLPHSLYPLYGLGNDRRIAQDVLHFISK